MRKGKIFTPTLIISDASTELVSLVGDHLKDFLHQRGHNSQEYEVVFSPKESSYLKTCIDKVLSDSDLFLFSLFC